MKILNLSGILRFLLLGGIFLLPQFLFAKTLPSNELKCMAEAIYYEARGESTRGKLAVGQVIMNRVASYKFPNTICKVVYEPNQFSWSSNAKRDYIDSESIRIAKIVMSGNHYMAKFPALYFHNKDVSPGWNRRKVAVIGNHIFYK